MNAAEEHLANLLITRFGLPAEEIDLDATFGELQIDSISLVELTVISQDEFGVPVGDEDFTAEHTLRTAAALLAQKGARV